MRDGKLDGMQDFDDVIKNLIESKTISLEDGLGFATNQNNLLLKLRGLLTSDGFAGDSVTANWARSTASVLDMLE